jgi:hypothetical protein
LEGVRYDKSWGTVAISVSLLLHLLLAWAVLRLVIDIVPPPRVLSVIVVRPPPPPKPVVVAKHAAASAPLVVKPIPHAAPGPVTHAKPHFHPFPARVAPPPGHFGAAGAAAGLGLNLSAPSGGGGSGHGGLGAFEDAVRRRIQAAKTYPPGIPYIWNECVVEYQVIVSQTGQLVSYSLYGCGNPFIDSAARAAILMASPYPVPPDFGGTRYTVFGSLVFRHSEVQQ